MVAHLPNTKSKEIIKILEKNGFALIRQKGSHRFYRKGAIGLTVPYHKKDLKPGTLCAILKQAGLSVDDLIK